MSRGRLASVAATLARWTIHETQPMKYLAILKDSLREAIDTKIIYFTLGLSCLLILLIGSVTFRPMSAQEEFESGTEMVNWLFSRIPEAGGLRFDVVDFQQTNAAAEPWRGDYRFVYVIQTANPVVLDEMKRKGGVPKPAELESQFKRGTWIDQVKVTEEPAAKPSEVRYLVETKGTKVTDRRGWTHKPSLLFGALPLPTIFQGPLSGLLEFITDKLIGTFGAGVTMLISTIITAFFIPNMMRKGTIDLLLAKPIHRTTLLIYKFLGGLTFMFLNTVVIMVGIWLVLALQSGLWLNGLLVCVLIFTFQFAIFYSVSTLMAVLTRSPIVAILTTVAAWAFLFGVGWGWRWVDTQRPEKIEERIEARTGMRQPRMQRDSDSPPNWLFLTADVLHLVTPHYKELDALTTRVIRSDLVDPDSEQGKQLNTEIESIRWSESIIVTVLFIALMLALSCWRFATRDY